MGRVEDGRCPQLSRMRHSLANQEMLDAQGRQVMAHTDGCGTGNTAELGWLRRSDESTDQIETARLK